MLLGISLRLREFLTFRSLWLDEVALLIQIKRRSYEALLMNGVGGNQGAPAAFLLLSKLSLGTFSALEFGGRFISLLCGIGAMVVSAWLVTASFRDSATRLVGLLLIATSPWLVYYAAEGKHYMQEVFIAVLLVSATLRYELEKISLPSFAALGCVSIWFSHNAPVVVCACGGFLIVKAWMRGERRNAGALLCAALAWVLSFALHASTNMRALFGNRVLMNYWGHGLAPWRKGPVVVLTWAGDVWANLMGYIFIPPGLLSLGGSSGALWIGVWEVVLCVVVALGVVRMFRQRSPLLPYAVGIPAIAFILSLLRIAPFSSRLILYTAPFILLSAASGVVWLGEGARKRGALLMSGALGAFLCVVAPSVAISTERFIAPVDRSDMKGALRFLAQARKPTDLLVMRRSDSVVAAIYTKRDRALAMPFLAAEWKIAKPGVMCARLRKRLAHYPEGDVWFVGVLRSQEVAHAVDDLEKGCFDVTERVTDSGYFAARGRLRR
ncbi:MAG: hypothetical protein RIS36_714 [Pseudomonadota bacterium]